MVPVPAEKMCIRDRLNTHEQLGISNSQKHMETTFLTNRHNFLKSHISFTNEHTRTACQPIMHYGSRNGNSIRSWRRVAAQQRATGTAIVSHNTWSSHCQQFQTMMPSPKTELRALLTDEVHNQRNL